MSRLISVSTIYEGYFDNGDVLSKIENYHKQIESSNFWDQPKEAEKIISKYNELKENYESTLNIRKQILNNITILNDIEDDDLEFLDLVTLEIDDIKSKLDELEIKNFLNGPYDELGALLEFHAGAGGTEACDWANMLYRMYTRWCEKKKYKIEIIDSQDGDVAGIKSLTMLVRGKNVYGYLKGEKGVHRLVRISPFDSGARRHTSFASINVTPLFEEEEIDIDINPNDIRIDVYRSSGKGGQGVNTTDSAVRITHFPTGIVVTCQNERSQIQNKERAMGVLKNKLYLLELERREKELQNIKGDVSDINFGSQIRNYVMQPYSLVKDNRTNVETSDVIGVLDGDLDLFLNAYLRSGK